MSQHPCDILPLKSKRLPSKEYCFVEVNMMSLLLLSLVLALTSAQDERVDSRGLTCRPPASQTWLQKSESKLDCSKANQFPYKQYNLALKKNATVAGILKSYQKVSKQASRCPNLTHADSNQDSARQNKHLPNLSYDPCPSITIYTWHWYIYLQGYGKCYVLTPFQRTYCFTYFCIRSPLRSFYHCHPIYRRIYFWAFCPENKLYPFVFTYLYISKNCHCVPYFCW